MVVLAPRLATVPALLLVLTACGAGPTTSDDPAPSRPTTQQADPTSPAEPSPGDPAGPRGTQIITADSEYGVILYDRTGQPIYLFDAESGDRPKCYDECAEGWPPVLTDGEPRARGEVRTALLGTTRRSDGTTQVTYDGHPLYFYAHEGKYQVLCHDVVEYGGTWLVVRPDGTPAPA